MTRRVRRGALVAAAALLCGGASQRAPVSSAPRPDVVFIVADDLGYGDVGFAGSTQIPTPHLDRLAAGGVVFTQGYVSAPVCSPSRAGFLTGRNQVSFGYDNNLVERQPAFDPEYAGLPTSERTIAARLREAGYATGLVGKWHLGSLSQFHPLRRGFDEFWGFLGGSHHYFPPSEGDDWRSSLESSRGALGPLGYLTDDIGTQAVSFIQRSAAEPFFLYVSFNAPHTPMEATAGDLELFAGIPDERRRTYCAMVHRLDVNVGRILDALDEAGLSRRTLVVFISDNGGPVDQNGALNAPLRGQKGILLEGGVRVPFVARWPDALPAGARYEHPVSALDLAPTFLAAAGAGAPAGEMDGVDLVPFVTGAVSGRPHEELRWRFTISAALRDGDWKLIRLPDRLPMLYHVGDDVAEQNDVALQHPARTRKMLKRLGDWDVELPHPLFLEGAVWKRRQLDLYDREYPLEQPAPGAVKP